MRRTRDGEYGERADDELRSHVSSGFSYSESSLATSSANASEAVNPGDSMPNKLTNPATPCSGGPWITKSAAASPGPEIFGRIPAYPGASAPSGNPGQYRRMAA